MAKPGGLSASQERSSRDASKPSIGDVEGVGIVEDGVGVPPAEERDCGRRAEGVVGVVESAGVNDGGARPQVQSGPADERAIPEGGVKTHLLPRRRSLDADPLDPADRYLGEGREVSM